MSKDIEYLDTPEDILVREGGALYGPLLKSRNTGNDDQSHLSSRLNVCELQALSDHTTQVSNVLTKNFNEMQGYPYRF